MSGLNGSFLEFAKFEIRCKEIDRARAILKWALENLQGPKDTLTAEYTLFEKQYGTMDNIEAILLAKRKEQYEAILKATPFDYDAWFDYLKMLEQQGKSAEVLEAYERAVANVPPSREKRFWRRWRRESVLNRRYIYLWIYYALYAEVDLEDVDRAREVYKKCLQCIPHKSFTFGKVDSRNRPYFVDLDPLREAGDPPEQPRQGSQGAHGVRLGP